MKTKRFIIHCDQEFTVYQANVHIIEAETKEEAIEILKENPSQFCVDTETLHETEIFLKTDFQDNFEIEEDV